MRPAELHDRFRQVRDATGLKQTDFAAALNGVATVLYGAEAPRFTQTRVSDIERRARDITVEDLTVYASVDPKRRGVLWLGWDGVNVGADAPPRRHGPSVIQEPPEDVFHQGIPRKKPGRRQA